jgi:hypothetical protein
MLVYGKFNDETEENPWWSPHVVNLHYVVPDLPLVPIAECPGLNYFSTPQNTAKPIPVYSPSPQAKELAISAL